MASNIKQLSTIVEGHRNELQSISNVLHQEMLTTKEEYQQHLNESTQAVVVEVQREMEATRASDLKDNSDKFDKIGNMMKDMMAMMVKNQLNQQTIISQIGGGGTGYQ